MSGILRRTAYSDNSKGYWMFHDWARVQTGLGTMAEPWMGFQKFSIMQDGQGSHDPTDMIQKVDVLENVSMGREMAIWADTNGTVLHGGRITERTGY